MYFKNKNGYRPNYEPRVGGRSTMAMSSQDKVKFRMLELKEEAEDNLTEFIGYKMMGKIPVMVTEKAQSSIIQLFLTIKPHIRNYINKQDGRLKTLKREDDLNRVRLNLEDTKKNYEILDGAYKEILQGHKIKEDNLYTLLYFLGQFMYDLGVTRIEFNDKDPIQEFSESAYGQNFEEETE